MINITFWTKKPYLTGLQCKGHAGYAEHGKDIVCAGVSACLIGIASEINRRGDATCVIEDGMIDLSCKPDDANQVLLSCAYNAMRDMEEVYPENIRIAIGDI